MLEKMRNSTIACARTVWLLGVAMSMWTLTGIASADSLSTRVIACAAETDSLRRVACFDKNVTPFAQEAIVADAKRGATANSSQQDQKSTDVRDSTAQERAAQAESRHIRAHVVSIDTEHDLMEVHLDNGQVWEPVQKPGVDMKLRPGDSVRIDKRSVMGSYWLGGPTPGAIKVRLKE